MHCPLFCCVVLYQLLPLATSEASADSRRCSLISGSCIQGSCHSQVSSSFPTVMLYSQSPAVCYCHMQSSVLVLNGRSMRARRFVGRLSAAMRSFSRYERATVRRHQFIISSSSWVIHLIRPVFRYTSASCLKEGASSGPVLIEHVGQVSLASAPCQRN